MATLLLAKDLSVFLLANFCFFWSVAAGSVPLLLLDVEADLLKSRPVDLVSGLPLAAEFDLLGGLLLGSLLTEFDLLGGLLLGSVLTGKDLFGVVLLK